MPSLNPGGHSHYHTGSEPLEGGFVRSWGRGSYLPTGSLIPGVGDWAFTRDLEKVTTVGFLPQVSGNFHPQSKEPVPQERAEALALSTCI